jgi:hypothetical protein
MTPLRGYPKGSQLDLLAAVTGLPLFDAAIEVCERMGITPPRMPRHPESEAERIATRSSSVGNMSPADTLAMSTVADSG